MGRASSPIKKRGAAGGGGGDGSTMGASGSGASNQGCNTDRLLIGDDATSVALALAMGDTRSERVESTIVSRENATHAAFAQSRRSDFVYAPSEQYVRVLNDYCSAESTSASSATSSPLLVVVGAPGSGKSSLLAHWAHTRRCTEDGAHELIHEHYCGCSYDSVKLSLFLFRFMTQIKLTYALRDFEIPHEHEEEKLKFSFSRCLEAATKGRASQDAPATPVAKRQNIVLVLDGIDCIRTEDGGDSLSWLPTAFPPGVRIILSASASTSAPSSSPIPLVSCTTIIRRRFAYDQDHDLVYDTTLPVHASDSHCIRELRRRQASFVMVEPLDEHACRSILELYSAANPSPALGKDEHDDIVRAAGSASPLFVRLVLHGLALSHEGEDGSGGLNGEGATDNESEPMREDHRRDDDDGDDNNARGTNGRREWSPTTTSWCREWLERVAGVDDLYTVYELLMQHWNELLLHDLRVAFDQLLASEQAVEQPVRRIATHISKREVTPSPSSSVSATPSSLGENGAGVPEMSAKETLQTAMEQHALLVRHTLSLLAASRYGLSEADVIQLVGDAVPRTAVTRLLTLLRPHLLRIHRVDCDGGVVLLDLSHNALRLLVRYGFLHDDALRQRYFAALAAHFERSEACQRRVDELPVQLERCHQWGALQNALVDMRMFQLWWRARNRHELYSFWRVLRAQGAGLDPADAFTRAIDEYAAPSADHVLALVLAITEFLRCWQRLEAPTPVAATVTPSGNGKSKGSFESVATTATPLALHRPEPPQLHTFLAGLAGFSTAHLDEHEAARLQLERDALVVHAGDGYVVRRWLWVQFPLIAVAFESRVLRPTPSPVVDGSGDTEASTNNKSSAHAATMSVKTKPKLKDKDKEAAKSSATSVVDEAPATTLPRTMTENKLGAPPSPAAAVASKRASKSKVRLGQGGAGAETPPSTLAGSTTGPGSTTTDAFAFVSADQTEAAMGSVASREAALRELRTRYDKLRFTVSDRQQALRTLESRLLDARAQHHERGRAANSVDALRQQARRLGEETQRARQRREYYRAILRHCELHPARDPRAIESAESAVVRLQRDATERQQRTQQLRYETRRAASDGKRLQRALADKARIHRTALARLRWRLELLRRRGRHASGASHGSNSASGTSAAVAAAAAAARHDSYEDDESDEEGDADGDALAPLDREREDEHEGGEERHLRLAKDKLLHKRETTHERRRKVASLQSYVGSAFRDDGVLGALRHAGVHELEHVELYWRDQQSHAEQLEREQRDGEQRVGDARQTLAALHARLRDLQLGGGSLDAADESSPSGGGGGNVASPDSCNVSGVAGPSGASASTHSAEPTAAAVVPSSEAHNLKLLSQRLQHASGETSLKKARARRLRVLHDKLELGLQHVARVLGVDLETAAPRDALELADAVEHVVRLALGDDDQRVGNANADASWSATSVTQSRRSNSMRSRSPAALAQTQLQMQAPNAARSPEERRRYNVRVVGQAATHMMNPYEAHENVEQDGDEEHDDDDEDDGDDDEDGEDEYESDRALAGKDDNDRDSGSAKATDVRRKESVTRRRDIKRRARCELDRRRRPVGKRGSSTITTVAGNSTSAGNSSSTGTCET